MLFSVYHCHLHQAVAKLHGCGHGLFQPLFNSRLHQQTVNHYFNGVILALIELDLVQLFIQMAQLSVNPRADKPLLRQLRQLNFEFTFASADQRSHDHDSIFRLELHYALHNLFR